jgi:hypothetical protein
MLLFESSADNTYQQTFQVTFQEFNAYQLVVIDQESPDGAPMLFQAGQRGDLEYRVAVYESLSDNTLTRISTVRVPALCGASIPQIAAADVMGSEVPEIILDRLCNPVPVYHVGQGGALSLVALPFIEESLEVIATSQTSYSSGAIAIGTFPCCSNPQGYTLVLEMK